MTYYHAGLRQHSQAAIFITINKFFDGHSWILSDFSWFCTFYGSSTYWNTEILFCAVGRSENLRVGERQVTSYQGCSTLKGRVGHVSTSFWVSKDNFSRILPQNQVEISDINTQYMRNPDMVYVLKMEYVSEIDIFGPTMMVKSGLEKIFLKFLHAQSLFQKIFFTS